MATITKRKDHWFVQVRLKDHKPIRKSFDTESKAIIWAANTETELKSGVYVDPREIFNTSLSECFDRYRSEISSLKKGASQESYRIAMWQADELAKKPIGLIRSVDIAQWRDNRLTEVRAGTVRLDLAILAHLFTIAIKEWSMPLTNPVINIRKPPPGKARERRISFSEEKRLLAEASVEMRVIIIVAIETAMRRGEIASARRDWIVGKVLHLPDTKNGSARKVPLSPTAIKEISSLPINSDGRIFNYTDTGITCMFGKYCKRLGIIKLCFHDLRHEATSRFFEKDLSVMEVESITSHKSMEMLTRYTHINADRLADKLAHLSALAS